MDIDILMGQLLEILPRFGISYELRNLADDDINVRSGLCEINGRKVLMVDRRLDTYGRIKVIMEALENENLDDTYIPPATREAIETFRG